MNYEEITIHKPLHDNFCYIRASIVDKAHKEKRWLKITTPKGTGICSPSWWKGTGKVIHKVFKYEDNPMKMYGNNVPILHG